MWEHFSIFLPLILFSRSVNLSALILRVEVSPRANISESITFDLPEPLGPETVVKPVRIGRVTLSQSS